MSEDLDQLERAINNMSILGPRNRLLAVIRELRASRPVVEAAKKLRSAEIAADMADDGDQMSAERAVADAGSVLSAAVDDLGRNP